MSLDLEKQLVQYGSYHHNQVNIGIHMICVPAILVTSFLLAAKSGTLLHLPSWLTVPYLPLNAGTIASFIWGGFYVLMEPVAGGLLCIMTIGAAAVDNYLLSVNARLFTNISSGIFIVSWIAQFVGHGKFEGRAPALLDNLLQAIFLAPFFVWMELLFRFGYRQDLQDRVNVQVEKNVARFKHDKAIKNGKAQ